MRRETRLGLEAGARMLSFGLVYLPGAYAETDELVAVAEEAAAVGAPLVPHVRNEGSGLLEAVGEMIDVARRSGAPLHLSHLKSLADERLVEPLLELLEDAATRPRSSRSTSTPTAPAARCSQACSPAGRRRAARRERCRRSRDAASRRRIAHDIADGLPGWENLLGTLGPERIEIANAAPPNEGGRRPDAAASSRTSAACDAAEAALDLMLESALDVTMVLHYASDDAVREIARHRLQLVGSDGIFGARPHPRLYATAPRFLGRFAIRDGLIPVEEAVARLTARVGRPARARGPRAHRAGQARRPRPARPAAVRRHGDVRRPAPLAGRRRGRLGRRRPRARRRSPDRGAAGRGVR